MLGGWRQLTFTPFREGIEIHRIYGDGVTGPAAAVLRYQPGAGAPLHEHLGFEHIVMLDGIQRDERGAYGAGTMVVNPPGSRHRVWSDEGCIALLIWEKPVRFLETGNPG
ncbi:MAG: cupin domain-containing protein [Pseudomonadota bacterium]